MSCSLRLPLRQPRPPLPVTTPLTCLLSAEAARVVLRLSVCLSPSLPCLVVCFVCHKSRVFCVHFGGKLQVVVRRFVALFNLDKLKTMPHLPHATHTLATWGTERGRERGSCQHFAQVASAKGVASLRSPFPLLFIAAERNKLRMRGMPPLPLVAHATCPLCNIRAIDAAAIEAENEKGKRNGATCHLPPATHLGASCLAQLLHRCLSGN